LKKFSLIFHVLSAKIFCSESKQLQKQQQQHARAFHSRFLYFISAEFIIYFIFSPFYSAQNIFFVVLVVVVECSLSVPFAVVHHLLCK
jgi:hypothetical protein